FIDATAIMVIVIINGCIGFFQEQKAEKSLDKLRELAAPKTRVFREGQWKTIPAEDVVIGDIVRIKTGDRVPADIQIGRASCRESAQVSGGGGVGRGGQGERTERS